MTTFNTAQFLQGRKALVTGAGKRIGRAIAVGLAESGCDVVVHYHESQSEAEETGALIESLGRKAIVLQSDFRQTRAALELAEKVIESFGSLDILVNNASIFPEPERLEASNSILEEPLEAWEASLAINSRAPFFLIQGLAPALRQSAHGQIINILDTSASEPFISRAAHSVSKAALAAITTLAAKTFYGQIRVNALELGAILPPESLDLATKEALTWGGVSEVVRAVKFLLESNFVHGEIIRVDQGSLRFGHHILG